MKTEDTEDSDRIGFVLHFGGKRQEINAITLGKELVSFSELVKSICHEVNPDFDVEITVDNVGHGSFQVSFVFASHFLRDLFADISYDLVMQIVAELFTDAAIDPALKPQPFIKDGLVVIETRMEKSYGENRESYMERRTMPAETYELLEIAKSSSDVNRNMSRVIKSIDSDPHIENLDLRHSFEADEKPILKIPRLDFPMILQNTAKAQDGEYREEEVTLTVRVPILYRSKRKWEFAWNGKKISASVLDEDFFDRLEAKEISINHADKFSATLRIYENRDKPKYEITRLSDPIRR